MRLLNLDYVQMQKYVNLRCRTNVGCADPVQPFRDPPALDEDRIEHHMAEAWLFMFGDIPVPEKISTPCCAQFAVSKQQILTRSKEEYERYLTWLVETPLSDDMSGRIFEYLWHIIFGAESQK